MRYNFLNNMKHVKSKVLAFPTRRFLGPIVAILILGAFIAFFSNIFSQSHKAHFSSAEVAFSDTSSGGLSIVPASCPSNAHYATQCDEPPGPAELGLGRCGMNISPSNYTVGQPATLSWNAHQNTAGYSTPIIYNGGSISPDIGAVPETGSSPITVPAAGTRYVFSGSDTFWTGFTIVTLPFSCTYTVTPTAAAPLTNTCPGGQHTSGNQCLCDGTNLPPNSSGQCIANTCPAGQHSVGAAGLGGGARGGGICVCDVTNLPADSSGQCTTHACPTGSVYDPGTAQCIKINACTLPDMCTDATHLVSQCTGAVTNCGAMGAAWVCQSGQCIKLPPPIASISALPSLLSAGFTSSIAWTSQNTVADSCYVTGNNGDGVNASGQHTWVGTSGSHISSAIQSQTIYTLTCQGIDGSTITKSATITIIPREIET